MPPARRCSTTQSASRVFVDREEPRWTFKKAVESIPREGCLLRTWYGVGGQGKTALARELFRISSEQEEPKYAHLRRAMVDLHGRPVTDPDLLLVWIRNAFCRSGIQFPAFDLAFAIMWKKTRGEEPLPEFENASLFRPGEGFAEAVPDVVTLTRELLADTTNTIPLLGPLLRKVSQWAFDHGYRAWLEKTLPQLKHLYRDDIPIAGYKMSALMPWMLAQDLNHHLEKNPDHRFVLFVDEYERVMDKGGTGALRGENRFDRYMRDFIKETDGLLAIFFSREELPWKKDPDWSDDLRDNQHLLGGLSDSDAENWLRQVSIKDSAIREAIINGARQTDEATSPVFPLMLDLQVEHWRNLGERAQPESFTVSERDFQSRRKELVQRLLRDYDDPIQELVARLALAQRFDRVAFADIVETFNIPISLAAYDKLADLSIMTVGEDGWLSPHRAIADAIIQSEEEAFVSASRDALLKHFETRAKPDRLIDVTENTFSSLSEAARLRGQKGADGYVQWLGEVQETYVQTHRPQFFEDLWRTALSMAQSTLGEAHPDVATSYDALAYCLEEQSLFEEAELFSLKALEIQRTTLGEEHPDFASSCEARASALRGQGRFGQAEKLCRQALKIRLAAFGDLHKHVALSYSNLAFCLQDQGRFAEAKELHEEALKIRRTEHSDSHEDVATGCDNLGDFLQELGLYDEAEELYREALEIRLTAFGETHHYVAYSYTNLALCLNNQGSFEEAEKFYQNALEIRLTTLGETHLDVAHSYANLASCLEGQAQFWDAEPLYRKALEIKLTVHGEADPDVASSYLVLADCLRAQGFFEDAEKLWSETEVLCSKAIEIRRAARGETHPHVAESYLVLADCLRSQGLSYKAEKFYRKALEIRLAVFGEAHPYVAESYAALALCLRDQHSDEEAEEFCRKALEIRLAVFGEAHPDVASSYEDLAFSLRDPSRFKEAGELHQKALNIRLNAFSEAHPNVAFSYNNLASCLLHQRRFPEAEELCRKALKISRTARGERHPNVAEGYKNLADCLLDQGRAEDAEPLYEKACDILLATLGERHPDFGDSYQALEFCQREIGA